MTYKKKLKILHVMNDSVPLIGGYTTRSRSIVTHQKRLGLEPFVVTSVRQGKTLHNQEKIDGIRYFRTHCPDRSLLKNFPVLRLIKELSLFYGRIMVVARETSPDIIHAHSPVLCAIPAYMASRRLGIPMVYEIRAFWEDAAVASGKFHRLSFRYRCIRTLETAVCRMVDSVVVISRAMKADILARGISYRKLFVVPNGVDKVVQDTPMPRNVELLRRFGFEGKFVFGYLGTFYDFEGIDDFIDAFIQFQQRKKDTALLLIGGGEMEDAIYEKLELLKNPGIVLLGKVPPDKVSEYYALMDAVVYPRRSTRITEMTTPLKPLEAMAFGKPVICSDVGGLKELVGFDNGFFFPAEDKREMIKCFHRLLDCPALAGQMAKRGKKRALKERNWYRLIENYRTVYDMVVRQNERKRR